MRGLSDARPAPDESTSAASHAGSSSCFGSENPFQFDVDGRLEVESVVWREGCDSSVAAKSEPGANEPALWPAGTPAYVRADAGNGVPRPTPLFNEGLELRDLLLCNGGRLTNALS